MSFLGNVVVDRSLRSILVGNIPIDVSEEHLRELFSEFGLVLNIRFFKNNSALYVLCEYGNSEMALGAIRQLSNIEMKGRAISADIAGSEKSKAELQALQESLNESTGESVPDAPTEKAPEEISKAVASLPAEQMFELMKQMKMCIENNPQEARSLLLQNPQLAYALLQAQIIMRIVDPEVAMKILNRPTTIQPVLEPEARPEAVEMEEAPSSAAVHPVSMAGDQDLRQLPPVDQDFRSLPALGEDKDMRQMMGDTDLRNLGSRPVDPRSFRPADPRIDPRVTQGISMGQLNPTPVQAAPDPRLMAAAVDPRTVGVDPRLLLNPRPISGSVPAADPRSVADPRVLHGIDSRTVLGMDPRQVKMGPSSVFGLQPMDPRNLQAAIRLEDPRKLAAMPTIGVAARMPPNFRMPMPVAPVGIGPVPPVGVQQPVPGSSTGKVPEDDEKAILIMQVLQLSDQQIAVLPPEQRQSIMILKEQIARNQI